MIKPAPTVVDLMKKAFDVARDPRSAEYKAGVRAILEKRINGKTIQHPYPLGTAQADAYFAGQDEGHRIWRALQAEKHDQAE